MDKPKTSILFMDDEPHSESVEIAVSRLEEEGYEVDLVQSMSEAIEAYYQKYYEIFILDIDMSHVQDNQEGDGVQVLKHFVALHNKTRVILFSGAGTVEHWFAAANAHCYAYIAKDEPDYTEKLVQWVSQGIAGQSLREPEIVSKADCTARLLCYCEQEVWKDIVRQKISSALGADWEIIYKDSLEDVQDSLKENSHDFGLVLLVKEIFELWPEDKEQIQDIFSYGPKPQVITACRGGKESELRSSILFLANNHPFRMINIDEVNWSEKLEDNLKQAVLWYGRREIFKAESQALSRMHITIPDEAASLWDDFDPETDGLDLGADT